MALSGVPAITALADTANFAITARPYIAQLSSLPRDVFTALTTSPAAVKELFIDTNPLISAFFFSLVVSVLVLVAAQYNWNFSQVDRLWSILPVVYILHYDLYARAAGIAHARNDLALLWSTLWGSRLTYNFWRKGGYKIGEQDYRWPIIEKQIGSVGMSILNFTFISWIQSILLMAVSSPAYILLLVSKVQPELTVFDFIFVILIFGLLTLETISDQQQWNYQTAKHAYLKTAKLSSGSPYTLEDLNRGFNVSGLWAWSRHPNCACEQAIWITFYNWAAFMSRSFWNWTVAGAIGYVMIFLFSTPLTESITLSKYPQYKEYQNLVGRFVPGVWFPASKQKKN